MTIIEILDHLAQVRKAKGISYGEIAVAIGAPRKQAVAAWLCPKRKNVPGLDNLFRLATSLGQVIVVQEFGAWGRYPIFDSEFARRYVESLLSFQQLASLPLCQREIMRGIVPETKNSVVTSFAFEKSMAALGIGIGIREMTDEEIARLS